MPPRKAAPPPGSGTIAFRRAACETIVNAVGVYALCDLDGVPIYVGQSVDGIRSRVRRHLTSARSDIIANRQVDVWEAAWVWAWPTDPQSIPALEAALFHFFNRQSTLMNGSIPVLPAVPPCIVAPAQRVQIMSDTDITARRDPAARLPRQIEHYGRLVDHYLTVKDSRQIGLSLAAHFERLERYHRAFLQIAGAPPTGSQDSD